MSLCFVVAERIWTPLTTCPASAGKYRSPDCELAAASQRSRYTMPILPAIHS